MSDTMEPRPTLLGMPEELIEIIINFITNPRDAVSLAHTGVEKLHRIGMYEVLKKSPEHRNSACAWACKNGDLGLLRTTFNLGTKVDDVVVEASLSSTRGEGFRDAHTPLTIAIAFEQVGVVETLLGEFGANHDLKSPYVQGVDFFRKRFQKRLESQAPVEYAVERHLRGDVCLALVQLLLNRGMDPNPSPFAGFAIPRAIEYDNVPIEVLKGLIERSSYQGDFEYYISYIISLRDSFHDRFSTIQLDKIKLMVDSMKKFRDSVNGAVRYAFLECVLNKDGIREEESERLVAHVLSDYPELRGPDTTFMEISWIRTMSALYQENRPELVSDECYDRTVRLLQTILDVGVDAAPGVERVDHPSPPPFTMKGGEGSAMAATEQACRCVPGYHRQFRIGKAMELLIQNGLPPNTKDPWRRTPLHMAAKYSLPEQVEQLLESDADVDAVDLRGLTALHLVCRLDLPLNDGDTSSSSDRCYLLSSEKRAYIADLLLSYGANQWICDRKGLTPLHYACMNGFAEVVKVLLSYDAYPRVDVGKYDQGTPLHFLSRNDKEVEQELFRGCGAPVRAIDRVDIARQLVDVGADVDEVDQGMWSPMVFAKESGYQGIVDFLLDRGAPPRDVRPEGWRGPFC